MESTRSGIKQTDKGRVLAWVYERFAQDVHNFVDQIWKESRYVFWEASYESRSRPGYEKASISRFCLALNPLRMWGSQWLCTQFMWASPRFDNRYLYTFMCLNLYYVHLSYVKEKIKYTHTRHLRFFKEKNVYLHPRASMLGI